MNTNLIVGDIFTEFASNYPIAMLAILIAVGAIHVAYKQFKK